MYQDLMNAMGTAPAQLYGQSAEGPPPGMTWEMWQQMLRMQQMGQEQQPNSRPMMMADATNLIRQYGGGGRLSTDGLSLQTRAGLAQLEREEQGGQSAVPPTQPVQQPRESTQTVDQEAVRRMLQRRSEEDASRISAKEAARLEDERIRRERYERAMKVNLQ
jgi:hypothetical protein